MSSLPRTVGLLALSFALLSLVACGSGPKDGDASVAEPIAILAHQHGQQSEVSFPAVKHITSAEQFEDLGLAGAEPAVFDTEDMVLVALGQQNTGGHWVRITGLQRVGDSVYVQATVNRPGEDAATTQALTQPYCIITTPKLGDVELRSDITSVVGMDTPAE
ncbi:MAG: protease complex subunit PrcB family protein [Planctomycetes bacterium]|jgi:hypothetical protein|nr:protease complex subunit PrcB family protein [Planctomycetota bacterium]